MDRLGVGALYLSRPANFAWYTCGADSRVDHTSPEGIAGILLTAEGEYVVTDNVEAPRMREEQTPEMEVVEHPWHEGPEDLLRELSGSGRLGTDLPAEGATEVETEILPLRLALDEDALEGYRLLGRDASAALSEVEASLSSQADEREAAAALSAACRRRGMSVPVLLAASGERMGRYRHPIPHGGPLGRRAMLVACAERGGLYANLTRVVDFEELDSGTARRQSACEEILRRMREEATLPGRTLAEAFNDCRRFYAEAGFPEGWRDHHQGGITGYASREVVAVPGEETRIQVNQALAWNPSLPYAKTEETFVLLEGGPEVLAS